jgi:hypothetical protein
MKTIVSATSKILFATFIMITLNVLTAGAQVVKDKNMLVGTWMGKLEVNGLSLRLVFNISAANQDTLKATMESPDQGTVIIPMGNVLLAGDSIVMEAKFIGGKYSGKVTDEKKIAGSWSQSGIALPLNLEKQEAPFRLNRPQHPVPPFPYRTEEVKFRNDAGSIVLAGTLTLPEGEGPFPAAILITGSGAQNRDEELLGHKPFAVIADHLTRNGIAVLRYDDRGVGQSEGDYSKATSADLATDANAAFLFLAARKDISKSDIGFIGHSEGGLIAPIVASQNNDVAWIISLAGPGVTGEQVITKQSEEISLAMGNTAEDVASAAKINKKLYAVLKKTTDNAAAEEKMVKVLTKELKKLKVSEEIIKERVNNLRLTFGESSYTWFRFFLFTDPAQYWMKVKNPVLVLNGEKDLQVNAAINTAAISEALKSGGNNSFEVKIFPGLNHLFQHCETGLVGEYGTIEETMSPEVLATMAVWIRAQGAGY